MSESAILETVDAAVIHADPQYSVAVFVDRADNIPGQAILPGDGGELSILKSYEPEIGADPETSAVVLVDNVGRAGRKAFFLGVRRIILPVEFYQAPGCSEPDVPGGIF